MALGDLLDEAMGSEEPYAAGDGGRGTALFILVGLVAVEDGAEILVSEAVYAELSVGDGFEEVQSSGE